jgi:transcription factor STE12
MYSSAHNAMPPPQARSVAPETFLLDQDAQQSLPPEAIVALQQVDNREYFLVFTIQFNACLNRATKDAANTHACAVKYFLISAPVDWSPDQYIRRFLLPTGEYVSCVLW